MTYQFLFNHSGDIGWMTMVGRLKEKVNGISCRGIDSQYVDIIYGKDRIVAYSTQEYTVILSGADLNDGNLLLDALIELVLEERIEIRLLHLSNFRLLTTPYK